jgi:hypothetical protein
MKRICLAIALLFFLLENTGAQKIQYARQTIKEPEAAYMQLVANIGGAHHLLYFNYEKKPVIYVFDSKLQSHTRKEIDIKSRRSQDINILPFSDHYLLYFHSTGSTRHYLFRVNPDGASKDISACLDRAEDSSWNRSKATYQLFNQNERLVIVNHTYYDLIKKMGSTLIRLDDELNTKGARQVLTSFDATKERLEQVVLAGKELFVMKTGKNIDNESEMTLSRTNIETGHTIIKSFNAGNHLYFNPTFRFNVDSSILVSSLITELSGYSGMQKVVFVCNLGDTLQEIAPVTLLKNQFRKKAADNFLLFGEKNQSWVHMGVPAARRTSINYNDMRNFGTGNESALNLQNSRAGTANYLYSGTPTAIRFSLMNERFKMVRDSIVANDGNIYDVLPGPFGKFVMKGKAYLVLVQNFSPRKRGLVLLSGGDDGSFLSHDIPVFDRYQYLLSQLQPVGDEYFILPYTHKNETGLVKVTMKE